MEWCVPFQLTQTPCRRTESCMGSIPNLLFGFFRSREICSNPAESSLEFSVDSLQEPHRIRIGQINPFHKGNFITLLCTQNDLCPVAALLSWVVYRGLSFHFHLGTPLTRARLVTELRKALADLGLEAQQFSGHSFQKGTATTAAAQGIPDSQIKILGHWKSSAF